VIRKNDLVKFVGPTVCKYFCSQGSLNALIEDGTLGIVIKTVMDPYMYHYICEVLVGNEIFNASMDDLAVLQSGEKNVV